MRRYGSVLMLGMVCLVLLVGLPMRTRAETAGMTVTAVKEKDEPEPSSGPSEEPDDSDEEPDDTPDEEPENNPDDESGDDSDEDEDKEPEDNSDDEPDDEPEDNLGDKMDDEPESDPDKEPDNNHGESDDMTGKDEDKEIKNNLLEESSDPNLSNETETERSEQKQKSYKRLIKMIPVVIALIGAGVLGAVMGLWDYLWGLVMWYLFRKRKAKWHGILTEDENRFLEICPASDDYRLAQEIIDYSSEPTEALRMLEETGDVTYLPKCCKVWVGFWMDGECRIQRVKCDENRLYEFMANLGDVGEKKVLIESRAAGIAIWLIYP